MCLDFDDLDKKKKTTLEEAGYTEEGIYDDVAGDEGVHSKGKIPSVNVAGVTVTAST